GSFAVLQALLQDETGDPPVGTPGPPRLSVIRHPGTGEVVDHALVTVFPAPGSYTGEDVVEISGHGGVLAPALLLEAVLEAGARPAEPGEFTRRAYLNGKVDLVQAEAILDLVQGRSRALHRTAVHQLDRGLSRRIGDLRERVIGLEALLAHHLDFPDEDEPPTPVGEIRARARELAEGLRALARTAPEGRLLRQGALVVLAGRPNAGKSSLFNALVGEERTLVTEIPGTTRDAVEVEVSLGGYPFRLVDTAGLRDTTEVLERMGMEVAARYLESADLVLVCVESDRRPDELEERFLAGLGAPRVLVRTKGDLARDPGRNDAGESHDGLPDDGCARGSKGSPEVTVSVTTGQGLDELRKLLPAMVFQGLVTSDGAVPVLTRERQARAVGAAENEVRAFEAALAGGVPAEVASAHLKSALSELEAVVGVVTGDEVLDRVFRSFCIGK
ncbi:MAG: tRNA uridine-5-carboxymethylaminomethyl(34) synthesis GTPase MnmE, partial [Gemmatimonadota bacterium]